MSDWNRAFKNDYTPPAPITDADRQYVQQCEIKPVPGKKTYGGVYRNGRYIGMVRTKLCGTQEYIALDMLRPAFAGFESNPDDPEHALAIIALRDHYEQENHDD